MRAHRVAAGQSSRSFLDVTHCDILSLESTEVTLQPRAVLSPYHLDQKEGPADAVDLPCQARTMAILCPVRTPEFPHSHPSGSTVCRVDFSSVNMGKLKHKGHIRVFAAVNLTCL